MQVISLFLYFVLFFTESLPPSRRNPSTAATFQQALEYVNPVKLFRLVPQID